MRIIELIKSCFNIYKKHKEGFNYLIFGGLTTVLSLAVYYLLTFTVLDANVSLELQVANIISWIVGFLFAYFTNRKFVFESKNENVKGEFFKFFLSRISTLFLDMAIMFVFVTCLKFNDKIFKIVSQVLVILGNYILSKCLVFKKDANN